MVQVHIFCAVAANKRKLLERVYTCFALADNRLRSRAYSIVVAIKRRSGENYDHKQACNDVQVTVNAAYGSRFLERTPRSFSNNRCLCYDDCATMLAWCLQNWYLHKQHHLYDTIGRPILWRQQKTWTFSEWRVLDICISQVKHLLFKPQGSWQRLSEKQITVITQAQAFKFDISSYLYPSYQIREKGEKFYNAFAQKWISPWRMFPSNRECVLQ